VLQGGHQPVTHELCVELTGIEGQIPHDLNGLHVPQRVPQGFHATWVSAERLARGC
jgi:carotenoid cleavage dioxygenase-like enzyme